MKMAMFLGMVFIWSSHPLLMMGSLLVMVIMGVNFLYWSSLSFWLGFLLMLVMLSGVMVIFSYMLSMIPNYAFENYSMFMPFMILLILCNLIMDKFNLEDYSIYVYSIWGAEAVKVTFYLVAVLLMLMVIVLYLSILMKGSLRII